MNVLVEKLIRKIKGDPGYSWDSSYRISDLLIIIYNRTLQLIRGYIERFFFKSCTGLVFLGKRVKISHASKISVEGNLIIGDYSNINALSSKGIVFGKNVSIGRNATLICTGVVAKMGVGISIGSGTGINDGAYLGGQGGIEIGENVIVGPGVKIFSENHIFSDLNINIKSQGVSRQGVTINSNCWIGANATILDGVILGSGCVVAAGAVVTRSFDQNVVIGGIPAKVIRVRN